MIEITYAEIGITLAVIAILALLLIFTIHVVKTLKNVNRTLDNVNALLEANRSNIDNSLKTLPQICENVNDVTLSLKDKTDLLDHFLGSDKEEDASSDLESLLAIASTAFDVITGITGKFGKKKKGIFKKK